MSADEIRELIAAERFDAAESALAAAGDDEEMIALRAELYRRTDRLEEAFAEYERLVQADPDDTSAQFWLATIHRWRGRNQEALGRYGEVLRLSECHHDALTGRARVFSSLDREAEAETDLRKALECHPGDDEATRLLAGLLAEQGKKAEAEALIRAGFSGVELQVRLGDLEMDADDPAEARKYYRQALELRPDDPDLLEKLADAERELDNNATALALYERSAQLAGDSGNLYWIGNLALRLDQVAKAEATFSRKLEEEPGDTGGLIGMARVRRAQGYLPEALEYVNQVLDRNPTNGEALVLRGALEESLGRRRAARTDYFAALQRNRNDSDARVLFDRIGPSAYFTLSGRSSESQVIEGLEDEGLIVDGNPIRPARIEYSNESVELETGIQLGAVTELHGTVSNGRESVRNMDSDRMIYDFDVQTATGGLNHQLNDRWGLAWRIGGTRYEPRSRATIETSDRARGTLELSYRRGADSVVLAYTRRPFIQRGFAADTQFSIFDEDRLQISWDRDLGSGMSLQLSTSASEFEESEDPVNGGITFRWRRSGDSFYLRAGHYPFPARFLLADNSIDFIDFDGITMGLSRDLPGNLRFSGDATYGTYGETPRDEIVNGVRVEGPLDNNSAVWTDVELAWSPRQGHPFSFGGAYSYEKWDFRTGAYNTRDTNDRSVFAELEDRDNLRFRYLIHASQHWISDQRSPEAYDENVYLVDLDIRLGSFPRRGGSYWLGLEGLYEENDLDEEKYRVRAYLTVPF